MPVFNRIMMLFYHRRVDTLETEYSFCFTDIIVASHQNMPTAHHSNKMNICTEDPSFNKNSLPTWDHHECKVATAY